MPAIERNSKNEEDPKIAGLQTEENTMKGKSERRPLKDLSNKNGGRNSSKSVTAIKKKEIDVRSKIEEQDDSLDRLLLVQSDLSSLIQKIDELVVKAFKFKELGDHGRKEIESFTHVLSDMHLSLKPWIPKFQKVLSHPSIESDDHLEKSLANECSSVVNETKINVIDSPDNAEIDALISPSPLVSWRAGCNIDRGRQLFLLTPLPISKSLSSKHLPFSKSVLDGMTSSKVNNAQPCFIACGDLNPNMLERNGIGHSGGKPSRSDLTELGITHQRGFASPPMESKKNCSMLVMTPCLKMSPPKSCVLLEPISESSHKDQKKPYKATPFPIGINHSSSDSDTTDGLAVKYPELLGIQQAHKSGIIKKEVEASPDWFMSPPKTCVLLEPSDSPSVDNAACDMDVPVTAQVRDSQFKSSLSRGINDMDGYHQTKKYFSYQDPVETSLPHIDSPPMWKECGSVIRVGKHAGEDTLKKELWVQFEAAAAANPYRSNQALKKTSKKGFLDLLEEASCDQLL